MASSNQGGGEASFGATGTFDGGRQPHNAIAASAEPRRSNSVQPGTLGSAVVVRCFTAAGDFDIVVNNFNEAPSMYEHLGSDGERIMVRLSAKKRIAAAFGATGTARAGDLLIARYLTSARGFASLDEPLLHLGLGKNLTIDELTIQWPGGNKEQYRDLPAGNLYTFIAAARPHRRSRKRSRQCFSVVILQAVCGIRNVHSGILHDSHCSRTSSPSSDQRSRGVIIDGDGDDDLFQGGAAGFAGSILINTGDGRFEPRTSAALEAVREAEDMGALFFEADGDGDLDLFVVSGGIEAEPGSSLYQDQLYLNDGTGRFTAAPAGTICCPANIRSVPAAAFCAMTAVNSRKRPRRSHPPLGVLKFPGA